MNFAQQQTYCRALGIDTWVARRPLAGAPRGHRVVPLPAAQPLYLQSQPAAVSTTAGASVAAPAARPAEQRRAAPAARAAGRQLLDDFTNSKPASRPVSAPRQVRRASDPGSGLRFTVICVVHEQLLLLDEITDLKFTPSAYNGWLKSIFYALGIPAANISVGQQDRLAWPPATSPVNPASPQAATSAAADMLHAWLQRKLAQHNSGQQQRNVVPPNILLMGSAPRGLMLAKGSPAAVGDMAELPLLGGQRALLLPGSNEIWAAPQRKRECWRHLQKLEFAGQPG